MHVYRKYKLKKSEKLFFYFKFHLFLLLKKLANNFLYIQIFCNSIVYNNKNSFLLHIRKLYIN